MYRHITKLNLFHGRSRTAYLYNGCLAWYNVLMTSPVHIAVPEGVINKLLYIAADSCDGGISVLNHCLSWSKFVNTHLSHDRQWFNIYIRPVK